MAKSTRSGASGPEIEDLQQASIIPEDQHPDFVAGILAEDDMSEALTPVPGGPLPGPLPGPFPGPIPGPIPNPIPIPAPHPLPPPFPFPRPLPVPQFCMAVSGRYTHVPRISRPLPPVPIPRPIPGRPGPILPGPVPGPFIPLNLLTITVRVDVDRFLPQNRISIELSRLIPRQTAHIVAEVTSDRCVRLNERVITANIVYRDGDPNALPGTTVTFRAHRGRSFGYGSYEIELSGGGTAAKTYDLNFRSRFFDEVEFEVDRVANAGTIVTTCDTGAHPNRPSDLPQETVSLETIYERSGFDVTMSPNSSVIPTSGTGANGTWSDAEMHNAMVTFWSRFADRPQWAMWVLYAARHDMGRSLGGIMFDDIGPNHRQGTAIFTDSFIQDEPSGDPNPQAWRDRMQFWTAVHEMGHAFNLAHAWQKALGSPWIPLANEPEARSFMNYPFRVSGGQAAFFSDFRFRFSDDELVFMRHAPRRFVQMGNSDWFDNHGFEAPEALLQSGNWALKIRPNRAENTYRFLEPVTLELKLTNNSGEATTVEPDMLEDGRHITVLVQREGGLTRQWRPMMTRCHETHFEKMDAGESIYGAHMISGASDGWTIDEPGFYKVQAAVEMAGEIVVSNVLRLFVAPSADYEENRLAPDYFTENVARVLTFNGAPRLTDAEEVLTKVTKTIPSNPAAIHAAVALNAPELRDFKLLDVGEDRSSMKVTTSANKVGQAAKAMGKVLLGKSDAAADTIGHIPYFDQLRSMAEALESAGAEKEAVDTMDKTIEVMKSRDILASVIDNAERRLRRRT